MFLSDKHPHLSTLSLKNRKKSLAYCLIAFSRTRSGDQLFYVQFISLKLHTPIKNKLGVMGSLGLGIHGDIMSILKERVVATCMFVYAAFTIELSPVESPAFPICMLK